MVEFGEVPLIDRVRVMYSYSPTMHTIGLNSGASRQDISLENNNNCSVPVYSLYDSIYYFLLNVSGNWSYDVLARCTKVEKKRTLSFQHQSVVPHTVAKLAHGYNLFHLGYSSLQGVAIFVTAQCTTYSFSEL